MSAVVIPPPQPEHTCVLPWRSGGYGRTPYPDYSITRCPECDQAWFVAPCYESLGPTQKWRRIRWWHWKLRARLAESEREVQS